MLKKWITALIGVFVFMAFTPGTFAFEYEDVPRDTQYFYPVDYLRRNDVFKDTKNFYPDILINKAEFIKYLVILNSPDFRPSGSAILPFEDTRGNAWYASYFREAIRLGILDEREIKVEPYKKLSYIEALTLLFHSQSIPIPRVYRGNIPYTDVNRNTFSQALIMRALSLDLMRPLRNDYAGIYRRVNRAEAARMIYKLDLVNLGSSSSKTLPAINNYGPELQKLISVWETIDESFFNVWDFNRRNSSDAAIRALVESLDDPYSIYMDEEENQNFRDSFDGSLEGIGAVIGYNDDDEISIISPLSGSPAEKAGIKAKDVILTIDDQSVEGLSLVQIVGLIKGPSGTTVKLKVRRTGGIKVISIKRDLIIIESVETEIIESGLIMRISISQFNNDVRKDFATAVDTIVSDTNIKGLIIDLRGNPGGLLDVAVKVLGNFVKAQEEVVTIDYKDFTQVLLSRGSAQLNGFPTVILIDNGSASASEIVAGTLQDYGMATIIGKNSFGKGTVQEIDYFVDESSLKLTIAKWLTPLKQDIQENGILPDVEISDNDTTVTDEQLDSAIKEIKRLIAN